MVNKKPSPFWKPNIATLSSHWSPGKITHKVLLTTIKLCPGTQASDLNPCTKITFKFNLQKK